MLRRSESAPHADGACVLALASRLCDLCGVAACFNGWLSAFLESDDVGQIRWDILVRYGCALGGVVAQYERAERDQGGVAHPYHPRLEDQHSVGVRELDELFQLRELGKGSDGVGRSTEGDFEDERASHVALEPVVLWFPGLVCFLDTGHPFNICAIQLFLSKKRKKIITLGKEEIQAFFRSIKNAIFLSPRFARSINTHYFKSQSSRAATDGFLRKRMKFFICVRLSFNFL